MDSELIRIFSDIHFGDRASRVHQLEQLRPLLEDVAHLVLNGDTLDTRPAEDRAHTERCRTLVRTFFREHVPQTTFITGNHDADFSSHHYLDLAQGEVFAIHGDILFDNIVPWSRDAPAAGRRIARELQSLPEHHRDDLDQRLAVFRRVAMTLPQRHQSEKRGLRYTLRYLADTVWPPHRGLLILHAWRSMPRRAAELARRCRPQARFITTGHIHRPGIWPTPGGPTILNTGTFTVPFDAQAIDLTRGKLVVRRIERQAGEFRPGPVVAEFPLAAA